MGRCSKPQKSKKNKKIKAIDPFYTGDRVADRDAERFNLAPSNVPLEQEYSNSIREFELLKNVAKTRSRKRKHHEMETEGKEERGYSRQMPRVPEFKKRRGETEEMFMRRVDQETQAIIHRSQFEDKYKLNEYDALKDSVKKPKQKEAEQNAEIVNKKKQRWEEKTKKRLLKKILKKEEILEREISDLTKSDTSETKTKASMISKWVPGQQSSSRNQAPKTETMLKRLEKRKASEMNSQREDGKPMKSKYMSPSAREAFERERERAIQLYRERRKNNFRGVVVN